MEGRETWDEDPPLSVLPIIDGDEDEKLDDAKGTTHCCYYIYAEIIEEFVFIGGAKSHRHAPDKYNYLQTVDSEFKDSFEKIMCLPKTEISATQDLMKQSCDIWKESRRLLCDFERPGRSSFPNI